MLFENISYNDFYYVYWLSDDSDPLQDLSSEFLILVPISIAYMNISIKFITIYQSSMKVSVHNFSYFIVIQKILVFT